MGKKGDIEVEFRPSQEGTRNVNKSDPIPYSSLLLGMVPESLAHSLGPLMERGFGAAFSIAVAPRNQQLDAQQEQCICCCDLFVVLPFLEDSQWSASDEVQVKDFWIEKSPTQGWIDDMSYVLRRHIKELEVIQIVPLVRKLK